MNEIAREEWMKVSWKKGECREEAKLVAQVSGISLDAAKVVVLRLYNHFLWLFQLRKRSKELLAKAKRKRQFLIAHAKHLPREGWTSPRDVDNIWGGGRRPHCWRGGVNHEDSCGAARGACVEKHKFGRYIRGLCALCTDGSFDQILDLLLRAYSVTNDDRMTSRNEMLSIVTKHVVYDNHKDPQAEKERTYRWLKRQFILLGTTSSKTSKDTNAEDVRCALTSPKTASRNFGDAFISWETARNLLRQWQRSSESSLAIDLPSLSKDMWSADLADVESTRIVASWK